ncbi:sortase [Candidatus Dojkabacteria bacterium]|nr:sortase [Candidatus Dojkabacteria bacterium]
MRNKLFKKIGSLYITIGLFLIVGAIGLIAYPQAPFIMSFLSINSPEIEVSSLTVEAADFEITPTNTEPPPRGPQLPPVLPQVQTKQKTLEIPSIGIISPIDSNTNAEVSLKQGTWIVPSFSKPDEKFLNPSKPPVILAAHRFGYSDWSIEKRGRISFYNLPSLEKGDKVNILWEGRKYTYKVTDGDENKFIKKGNFDLVLYTCKLYNSPLRIFRYAKLISINEIRVELL